MNALLALGIFMIVSMLAFIIHNQLTIIDKRKAKAKRTDWDYLLNLDIYTSYNLVYMVDQSKYWASQMLLDIVETMETHRKRVDNTMYDYITSLALQFENCIKGMYDMSRLDEDGLEPMNSESRFTYYQLQAKKIMREVEYIKNSKSIPKKAARSRQLKVS